MTLHNYRLTVKTRPRTNGPATLEFAPFARKVILTSYAASILRRLSIETLFFTVQHLRRFLNVQVVLLTIGGISFYGDEFLDIPGTNFWMLKRVPTKP